MPLWDNEQQVNGDWLQGKFSHPIPCLYLVKLNVHFYSATTANEEKVVRYNVILLFTFVTHTLEKGYIFEIIVCEYISR